MFLKTLQGTILCMKKHHSNKEFGLLKIFNRVEKNHWWWEGRRYLLKSLLSGKNPKRILDIGCGTGETLTFLQKLFPEARLYGIDTSDKAVAYTKKRGHQHVVNASAESIPEKKETFDVILLLDVLEHIRKDSQVLLEVKRVLIPGGILLITSPALPLLWGDHDKNQGHYRRYTKNDFVQLSRKTGLKTNTNTYFNFFLSPIVIFVRVLGKIPPLRFLVQYDNGINYEVAFHPLINTVLSVIFRIELWLLKKGVRYPFGISLVVALQKDK